MYRIESEQERLVVRSLILAAYRNWPHLPKREFILPTEQTKLYWEPAMAPFEIHTIPLGII
jgi:hypothetical protein